MSIYGTSAVAIPDIALASKVLIMALFLDQRGVKRLSIGDRKN